MGFHPEDDVNEIIESDSFETEVDDVYSMIFIQRLSLLERASEKLRSKGYYDRTYGNYKVDEITVGAGGKHVIYNLMMARYCI